MMINVALFQGRQAQPDVTCYFTSVNTAAEPDTSGRALPGSGAGLHHRWQRGM